MIMTKLVMKSFRVCVEVCLWLNLISSAVAGYIYGGQFIDNAIAGAAAGLVAGMLLNILCGWFIVALLNFTEDVSGMRKGLEQLNRNLETLGNSGKIAGDYLFAINKNIEKHSPKDGGS